MAGATFVAGEGVENEADSSTVGDHQHARLRLTGHVPVAYGGITQVGPESDMTLLYILYETLFH